MVDVFYFFIYFSLTIYIKQNKIIMVQSSSFLLLLVFSAGMIQGAPLAAQSKEHHPKNKLPTEESKLQLPAGASDPRQAFGQQASGFGPTLTQPFVQQGPPLGTRGTRSTPAGSPAAPPSCMDPQTPQRAAELPAVLLEPVEGLTGVQRPIDAQGPIDAHDPIDGQEPILEPPSGPPTA
ncbi:hypothetical protein BCR42DRAFT_473649 [Absidia repens]|uniref:Uncharacterized protein n=1 Tax=Absidia repens TaxID=90262 RepID=A0A1X2HZP6_9FUNG|nr:hypothetical protein BCR42DRAFT_473649 [Absidia repens]